MKLIILTFLIFIMGSCTTWKAKYQESQALLEQCLSMPPDTIIAEQDFIADPFIIAPQKPAPVSDLALSYIPEYILRIDTVTIEAIEKDYYPVKFKPSYITKLNLDSISVWVRVHNLYEYGFLEQRLEMFDYEVPHKVKQETVYQIRKERDWRHVLAAGGIGVLLGAVIMIIYSRKFI